MIFYGLDTLQLTQEKGEISTSVVRVWSRENKKKKQWKKVKMQLDVGNEPYLSQK